MPNFKTSIGLYGPETRRRTKWVIRGLRKQISRADGDKKKELQKRLEITERENEEDYDACRNDELLKERNQPRRMVR